MSSALLEAALEVAKELHNLPMPLPKPKSNTTSWRPAKRPASPTSRRQAKLQHRLAHAASTAPPESSNERLGSAVEDWRALEGASVGELLSAEPDPLRALSTGRIPAIILRGALGADVAAQISSRLMRGEQWKDPENLGVFEAPGAKKRGKKLAFGGYGVMLSRNVASRPARIAQEAAKFRRLFEQHNLMQPVDTLRRTLEALSVGRKVGLGVDASTNASLSVGGAYRMHYNNGSFPLHFDSLHARELIRSSCGQQHQYLWSTATRGRQMESFTDLYRFPQQFAALITLQRSERAGAELSVYKLHARDIAAACNVPVDLTQHNVILESVDCPRDPSDPRWAEWHQRHRYSQRDMRRWREQLRIDALGRPLYLQPGDLYIFDANRVHTVHRVWGNSRRLSIGSFVGYAPDELRIWS